MNAARLNAELDELAIFSSHPAPAVTRVLFSPEDIAARAWLRERFEAAGLVVRQDAVGNLFARWEGADPHLPAVATGSHTDAIPNAGKYDGVVGVVGALEAVRTLQEEGFRPRRSIEIIMFTAEEPTRFGLGCLGSRLLSGAIEPAAAAALRDPEGASIETLRGAAGCEGALEGVPLTAGCYSAFVELHIEQGSLLEREEIDIGIVEKIAAPAAFRVRLRGEGGHAGAVLMADRHDAGLAGAEIALAIETAAKTSGSPDTVATTGVFRIEPCAINSVPAQALLEIDLRDTNLEARDWAEARIRTAILDVAVRRGVDYEMTTINADAPAICDAALVAVAEEAARDLGLSSRRMISRAYHDSLFMARLCPTVMVFIPCRHGWSHRPDEYASPRALANGVSVLARFLRTQAT